MWIYEKRLQYPVKITTPNAKLAQVIISQFGGPDGELAASQRYLSQRYTMPIKEAAGLLTDIGTEELAHVEIISTMIYQLMKDATLDEIKEAGLDPAFYANRRMALDEVLPWDVIDCGVSKEFLIREYKKAYEEKTTPSCREHCSGCGANKLGGVRSCCPSSAKNEEV